MQTETKQQALLVTTSHRGVFFGYGTVTREKIITLTNARMAVYWSADIKGVFGLAVKGPNSNCRIGPPVSRVTLQDVVSITEVSSEAVANWEKPIIWS